MRRAQKLRQRDRERETASTIFIFNLQAAAICLPTHPNTLHSAHPNAYTVCPLEMHAVCVSVCLLWMVWMVRMACRATQCQKPETKCYRLM